MARVMSGFAGGSGSRWLEGGAWLVLSAALVAAVVFGVHWWRIDAINRAIAANGTVALPASGDARVRYAAGWIAERALRYSDAVQAYTDAQAGDDRALAAQAWFALGNAYFKVGIVQSRE